MRTHKIKMPGSDNKYEFFFYLTCGWDTQEIEGRIKQEDPVRYSAITKINNAKPLSWVELTTEELEEVSGFIDDAIDIKKDHIVERGQPYSNQFDWTQAKQNALIKYSRKYLL